VIACLDAYYREGQTTVACVLADKWTDAAPHAELVRIVPAYHPYLSGQLFRRELPALLAVLAEVRSPLEAAVVDGYVWLSLDHDPGLGAHLYTALEERIPVVGIAKTRYVGAPGIAVTRGRSRSPLFITAAGIPVEQAAAHIREMHGNSRIPTLLKRVDKLSRFGAPASV
jgi:deoxyribonuclease V